VRILREHQRLCVYDQAIAYLDLGGFAFWRTASPRPLCGAADRYHTIVERRIAPEARLAPPSSLPPAFIVADGRLSVRHTGKPASFHALDVLCKACGLFGLGSGSGHGRLLSSRAGVHDEKTECCHRALSISVFHYHRTDDTLPMPASCRLRTGTARFFKQ
jgi:hypothetical protein